MYICIYVYTRQSARRRLTVANQGEYTYMYINIDAYTYKYVYCLYIYSYIDICIDQAKRKMSTKCG